MYETTNSDTDLSALAVDQFLMLQPRYHENTSYSKVWLYLLFAKIYLFVLNNHCLNGMSCSSGHHFVVYVNLIK